MIFAMSGVVDSHFSPVGDLTAMLGHRQKRRQPKTRQVFVGSRHSFLDMVGMIYLHELCEMIVLNCQDAVSLFQA